MKKILILTLKLGRNYGGILQAYALQQTINSLGYEAVTAGSPGSPLRQIGEYLPGVERAVRKLFKKEYAAFNITSKNTLRFVEEKMSVISMKTAVAKASKGDFAGIIVGSDQVWRKAYAYLPHTYLKFPVGGAVRVAYAASFGHDHVDEYNAFDKKLSNKQLRKFKAISVREESGQNLVRHLSSSSSEVHCDPTLLLAPGDYVKLLPPMEDHSNKGGVFYYCLDDSDAKQTLRQAVCATHRISSFNLIEGHLNKGRPLPPVEEWLTSFRDANFILTDSFHGMIFSIIFEKPFLVIANSDRGLARFQSLLTSLNLQARLVDVNADNYLNDSLAIMQQDIDWKQVSQSVSEMRTRGINYLKTNLK